MKLILTATNGATILVWYHDEMFHARRNDTVSEPQICLAVDLFEVIAELTGLDLEQDSDSAEAVMLADDARLRLAA